MWCQRCHQIPSWWWEHWQNSVKLDFKLIKTIAYPWLACETKRLVNMGLNQSCAVLQLSKYRWTVNRTAVLGPYRSSLFAVLVGYGPVQLTKGAPAREFRTETQLVSPTLSHEKKKNYNSLSRQKFDLSTYSGM